MTQTPQSNPLVSVLVPVFNASRYLEQCLNSLVDQTLKEIEIICINDGSTDSSLDILKKYRALDKRIKIIDKPNSGYGASMNQGMKEASGEYVGIVEPDDFVDVDMFETLYTLARTKECDIAKSNRYDHRQGKDSFVEVLRGQFYGIPFYPLDNQEVFLLPPSTTTAIYKNSFLKRNGLCYLETPGASFQDTGFAYKTLFCAGKVVFTERPFYHYRRDNENSSVLSSGKVFAIVHEFQSIDRFLDQNESIKRKVMPIYGLLRYRAYQWNYRRIDWLYRFAFMLKMSEEFKKLDGNGEICNAWFTSEEWKRLRKIIEDPESLFEEDSENYPLKKKADSLEQMINDLKQSNSYRIGRCITYLPRKAKLLFRSR